MPEVKPTDGEIKPTETPPEQKADKGDEKKTEPTVDLSTKVTLGDGGQKTIQELVEAHRQKEELSAYRENARKVLQGGAEFNDEQERAVRFVMDKDGYTPEDIDQYVNWVKGGAEEEPVKPDEKPNEKKKEEDPTEAWRKQVEAKVKEQEATLEKVKVESLQRGLNEGVQKALDNHEGLKLLFERGKELDPDTSDDDRLAMFREDLTEATMRLLRTRKAAGGQFQEDWFAEEALKAAELVAKRYRTVIGDPTKLTRAPETGSGETNLYVTKPPEDPKFEVGKDNEASAREKALEYTANTLSYLASITPEEEGQTKA